MQNKGAIKFFAILFAIVCFFQLTFTFITSRVESKAQRYAGSYEATRLATELSNGNESIMPYLIDSVTRARENYYLDSMSNEVVYNILLRKYTYKECKEREINLGLDLRGGMNVTMEVSIGDIVRGLSGNSQNPTFLKAMERTYEKQKDSQKDFVTLFGESVEEIDPNFNLASIFLFEFKDKGITANSSNDDVLDAVRKETSGAFDRTFNILRTRIDKFGVTQPNVQKIMASNRILVELPGVKDPERVRKLLQGTAQLEFWETYRFNEVYQYFGEANNKIASLTGALTPEDTLKTKTGSEEAAAEDNKEEKTTDAASDTTKSLLEQLEKDTASVAEKDQNFAEYAKKNPLYAVLNPAYEQKQGQYYPGQSATVGYSQIKDTAKVNQYLRITKNIFPRDMKLAWTNEPRVEGSGVLELVALKTTNRDLKAALGGEVITEARQDYDQNGRVEVSMSMNSEGAKTWKRLTGENIGRQIAIVLDDYVYSAPNVNSEIPNGQSSISGGNTTVEEAQDLANILKAGKLPARARIVEEAVVGPSLGQEAINAGLWSFIIAFILVLMYMYFYYNRSGFVADLALVANVFFLFGVLASFGAVLTMPGIAGIVLTLGMAVDANVIIYERIKEEVRAGKGLNLAITDGYKNAYSAIIDGNVTTLLTAALLYI
ncbi:MAG: protein translocase subunit SecD, partial [Bacteroidetes bacterium]|nr:protein translocase subunit SecD [Bacteroidota bacterium]